MWPRGYWPRTFSAPPTGEPAVTGAAIAAALDLHRGLIGVMVADTQLHNLVRNRIYDEPPEDPRYPFIRIGEISARPFDTDGETAAECEFDIEIYSRPTEGRVECTEILSRVTKLLHRNEVNIPMPQGSRMVLSNFSNSQVQRAGDGRSYIGIVSITAIVE